MNLIITDELVTPQLIIFTRSPCGQRQHHSLHHKLIIDNVKKHTTREVYNLISVSTFYRKLDRSC